MVGSPGNPTRTECMGPRTDKTSYEYFKGGEKTWTIFG